jgi:glycosyltransferase involved in cell wall biosynthesis
MNAGVHAELPRIGIVMPLGQQRGGAELSLLHFLNGIDVAQRHRIRLCFLEDGPLAVQARAMGYASIVVVAGRLRQLWLYARTLRAVYRWIRDERLHVVLSWLAKAHLYAAPAARFARVPAAWWQHGLPTRHGIDQIATLLPAQRILACSVAAARAQSALWGNRLAPVVIHPPVDLIAGDSAEPDAPDRAALQLPVDAPVVGIVARLQRWKGIHLLIEAAAQLRDRHPALRLLVVGGPHAQEADYPQVLRQQCAKLGMQDRVVFLGQRHDVAACMAQMDVVVNASDDEPFGMVIVEAMAQGRAVVAPRAAGPLEIITHGVDGLLFEPRNVTALADALHLLLRDAALRTALGRAARNRAQQFGVPRFTALVAENLSSLAAS